LKSLLNISIVIVAILLFVPILLFISLFFDTNNTFVYSIDSTSWVSSYLLTLLYAFITTFFQAIIGIFFASVFFFVTWGKRWRIIFGITFLMIPYCIPSSISVMSFDFMFKREGCITEVLHSMGWIEGAFLNSSGRIFFLLCLVSIWQYTPFFFILVLLAFLTTPNNMIAQARCDGATAKDILFNLLLPLAKPVILAVILLRLILMLGKVDIAYIYHKSFISSGAETLPVQIIESIFNSGSNLPIGAILLLAFFLLIPILIYNVRFLKK